MNYFSLGLSFAICKVGSLDRLLPGVSGRVPDSLPEGCSVIRRGKCRERSCEYFLLTMTNVVCIQEALAGDCPSNLVPFPNCLASLPSKGVDCPLNITLNLKQ